MTRLKIRIGLVCDSRLFREGLRRILAVDPGLIVAAEGESAQLRDRLQNDSLHVLLAGEPSETALRTCAELHKDGRHPYVILLAAEHDDEWAVRALGCGARGILSKSAGAQALLKAIRVVHQGQIWAARAVLARAVERLAVLDGPAHATRTVLAEHLTDREQEIVSHVTGGQSNREIAERLEISEATVKAHLTHIFDKLHVRDRAQLAAFCHYTRISDLRHCATLP